MKRRLFLKFFCGLLPLVVFVAASGENLLEVYRDAMANDAQFKEAEAQWLAAKEQLPLAEAAALPQINASAAFYRNHLLQAFHVGSNERLHLPGFTIESPINGYFNTRVYGLNLAQPLFNAPIWFNIRQASAGVKAATASYLGATQSLIVRTSQAYFNVLQTYDQLRFAREDAVAVHRQLTTTKQRYSVGLVAITDVYNTQAQFDQAVATALMAQNQVNDSLENLRVITGRYYQELMGLGNQTLPLLEPHPASMQAWVHTAEQQNYNLQAQYYSMIAAHEAVRGEAARNLPTVTLEGDYKKSLASDVPLGLTINDTTIIPRTSLNVDTEQATVGVVSNVNIFSGGSVLAATKQARFNYADAAAAFDLTHRQVVSQTNQDYLGVVNNITQVKADQLSMKSSANALSATKSGYDVGTRTMVDVLNAITQVYRTQSQSATDQYIYINNLIQLKYQAGTLSGEDLWHINSWLTKKIPVKEKAGITEQEAAYVLDASKPPVQNKELTEPVSYTPPPPAPPMTSPPIPFTVTTIPSQNKASPNSKNNSQKMDTPKERRRECTRMVTSSLETAKNQPIHALKPLELSKKWRKMSVSLAKALIIDSGEGSPAKVAVVTPHHLPQFSLQEAKWWNLSAGMAKALVTDNATIAQKPKVVPRNSLPEWWKTSTAMAKALLADNQVTDVRSSPHAEKPMTVSLQPGLQTRRQVKGKDWWGMSASLAKALIIDSGEGSPAKVAVVTPHHLPQFSLQETKWWSLSAGMAKALLVTDNATIVKKPKVVPRNSLPEWWKTSTAMAKALLVDNQVTDVRSSPHAEKPMTVSLHPGLQTRRRIKGKDWWGMSASLAKALIIDRDEGSPAKVAVVTPHHLPQFSLQEAKWWNLSAGMAKALVTDNAAIVKKPKVVLRNSLPEWWKTSAAMFKAMIATTHQEATKRTPASLIIKHKPTQFASHHPLEKNRTSTSGKGARVSHKTEIPLYRVEILTTQTRKAVYHPALMQASAKIFARRAPQPPRKHLVKVTVRHPVARLTSRQWTVPTTSNVISRKKFVTFPRITHLAISTKKKIKPFSANKMRTVTHVNSRKKQIPSIAGKSHIKLAELKKSNNQSLFVVKIEKN